MRWFLGLLLVVALIMGVLFGVGQFLLLNSLSVTRTASIERPRATVFAMVNDLRIAKEWSPYYALDPDAEFSFSADGPGLGQTMRWTSDVRDVGSGRMSITDSTENESVDALVELLDRATFNSHMQFARDQRSTSVAWTMSAQCAPGAINVPCRYMNLIIRSAIERQLDDGLARLKTLAEQLPNVDFEGFSIEQIPVEPREVLFVDVTLAKANPTFDDRDAAEREGIASLNNFITASSEGLNTDDIVRVFPLENGIDGRFAFSIGYAYTGAAPTRLIGVRAGQTPGGAALRVQFTGRRSLIPLMYQRLNAYRLAHRIALRNGVNAWEVVKRVDPPTAEFPNDPIEHTDIYYPVQ